jgi:hypothetical protein
MVHRRLTGNWEEESLPTPRTAGCTEMCFLMEKHFITLGGKFIKRLASVFLYLN